MEGEILAGGVANAGAVVRVGDRVLRPVRPHTASVHRLLSGLRDAGFGGAPVPLGIDAAGREALTFIPGQVAVPPYPGWAQTDDALASLTGLVRRFHQASARLGAQGLHEMEWSRDMADPGGGPVICHNDICLENVVFRDGEAVGLIDFDFAAPGDPVWDLAAMARMCVPVDDPAHAGRLGWDPADRAARTRLVADCYGLGAAPRLDLLRYLDDSIAGGGQWVLRQVEAGDPNFTRMWHDNGGMARFDRRRQWWHQNRASFAHALR